MLTKVFFTITLVWSTSAALAAGITNGDFESGDLSGWTVSYFSRLDTGWPPSLPQPGGYAAAVGTSPFVAPLEGQYSAVLAAMDYRRIPDCSRDPFNTTCPSYPPTGVPAAPAGGPALAHDLYRTGAYNGAYIGQDFDASAGDAVRWSWRWEGDGMDKMFAMLTNGERIFVTEGRAFATLSWESDPVTHQILNYTVVSGLSPDETRDGLFVIPSGGLWTLYFGIGQTGDDMESSWMRLDGVRMAVPEPPGAGLLLAGLVALLIAAAGRRRRTGPAPRPTAWTGEA